MAGRGKLYAEKEGNAMKFDDTPSREEREDFWLEIGPASAYYGTDSYETAKENGDASPDGKARGFEGAEPKEK